MRSTPMMAAREAAGQFGSHGGAAIGELVVSCKRAMIPPRTHEVEAWHALGFVESEAIVAWRSMRSPRAGIRPA